MNDDIIDQLEVLRDYHKRQKDTFRVIAYTKAISAIRRYPKKITSQEEARQIPTIGKGISEKIGEFLSERKMKKVEEAKKDIIKMKAKQSQEERVIEQFTKIWGVGLVSAKQLYTGYKIDPSGKKIKIHKGFKSLAQLRRDGKSFLNKMQLIGLKYYNELLEPIDRNYITIFKNVLKYVIDKEFGKSSYKLEIAGSYRRGKATSGDIDCLVSSEKFTLQKLVETLQKYDIITDILAMQSKKFMGIAHCPSNKNNHVRLDIEFIPKEEWHTCLLYFTGSKGFNLYMREKAKKKGYKLNEYGLYDIETGKLIPTTSEKQIFKILNIPYAPPENR